MAGGREGKKGWLERLGRRSGAAGAKGEKKGSAKARSGMEWLEESSANDIRLTEACEARDTVAK